MTGEAAVGINDIRNNGNKEGVATRSVTQWLDAPRSASWSWSAWILSTAVFVSLTILLGGPSQADSSQAIDPALLIAHGDWACAYPPASFAHSATASPLAFASPLYSLVSAAIERILSFSTRTPFPQVGQLGVHCSRAMSQVADWAQSTGNLSLMLLAGFVVWPVLAGGLVAMLRSSDQGRNGWEAATLMASSSSLPVVACLEAYFHPEDIMAMGLILLAMASVVRGRWRWAGVVIGLGVLTQLFAILATLALAVVVPREHRRAFAEGFAGVIALVVAPLTVATSGRVLHTVFFGTSRAGEAHVVSAGGTVVSSLGLHGVALFLLSRIAPMALALALAWRTRRQWGEQILEPVRLVSLVTTCVAMRLVFEVNVFGYYFMAGVVSLLVLDALRRRFRGETFALIWLITLAYSPIAWGFVWRGYPVGPQLRAVLPLIASLPVVVSIVLGVLRHRVRWYLVVWQMVVIVAFVRFPLPVDRYDGVVPSWCWQILLVTSLIYYLSTPLRGAEHLASSRKLPLDSSPLATM